MDQALDQAFFEILCERMGIDAREFKKSTLVKASTGRARNSKDDAE